MNELILVFPSKEYINQINNYKEEFITNNENIDGSAGLTNSPCIKEWLKDIQSNSKEESVKEGLVPSSTYLAIRVCDNKLVGMIDIRHRLNDYLKSIGGHIGYSVRLSERKQGYAKEMLNLALEKCTQLNIDKVLVTCNKENIASAKTILANNGILENEVLNNGTLTQRYWINLK